MDASSGPGSVLIVNPNVEIVVLPGCTYIGKLVPVAAISVAMEDEGLLAGCHVARSEMQGCVCNK